MTRAIALFALLPVFHLHAADRARNVILFLGDAGGLPTLHAGSIHAHNHPQKLFLFTLPHIALSETSSASAWVSDSAAGMTAIVTGQKTHNGVLSQSAAAVRREKDGVALKTLLEYAEERGLLTGLISNDSVTGATPAALYAHSNDRGKTAEIFRQIIEPRFGDGVDLVIGSGRPAILKATQAAGMDAEAALLAKGYQVANSLDSLPSNSRRLAVLLDSNRFDLERAVEHAIRTLSKGNKGYFLMVECDVHTDNIVGGLDRVALLDRVIQRTAQTVNLKDTLILFTADHSFDIRVHSGRKGEPLLSNEEKASLDQKQDSVRLKNLRRDDTHTGEQVLVAATGPGSQRVRGFLSNTDLFSILMAAYGWK